MTYRALLSVMLEIDAENVAQAHKVMKKVQVIHPSAGSSRSRKERQRLSWRIKTVGEHFVLRRKPDARKVLASTALRRQG